MGLFSRFEGKMEDTFEGAADKLSSSPISPVQIVKKAEKQMRREKMVSAGKQYAPTLYTVLVNPDDDQRLFGFYPTLAGETETRLTASAAADGLFMDGEPLVRFIVDESLKHGKFDIIAECVSAPIIAQLRAEEMQRYGMGGAAGAGAGAGAFAQQAAQPYGQPMQQAPQYGQQQYSQAPQQYAQQPQYAQQSYAQPQPYGQAPQQYGQQDYANQYGAAAYNQMPQNQPYGADSYGSYGYAPQQNGEQASKPPLPYVPEDEIDYSIDYGEYTFDSRNFQDYRDNGQADGNADEEAAQADAQSAPAPAAADAFQQDEGQQAQEPVQNDGRYGQTFEPSPDFTIEEAPLPAAAAPASAAPAPLQVPSPMQGAPAPMPSAPAGAPAYPGNVPPTAVFANGAGNVNAVPNATAVRARLVDMATGRSFNVASNRVLIGRDRSCSIVISDINASRQHAELRLEPQGVWVLTDLGSTNGTLVNGQPITRTALKEGDRITLGITDLIFTLR